MAHERVLFERLLADLDAGPLASQELLFPQPLELGAGQAALVQEWTETLEGLGFRLEGWSGSTVVLRAVPALLRGAGAAAAHRGARRGRRPAAQGRAAAAAAPRAVLRGLPRGHQGPRPAAARGDGAAHRGSGRHEDDALLLPARAAHRQPVVACATSSGSWGARGEPAAAARPGGADRGRQDRGGGAARAAARHGGRSAPTRARSTAAWTSAPASPPRRSARRCRTT